MEGEEFVILLPESECKDTLLVAERLRKAVAAIRFEEEAIQVTVSDKFVDSADHALYEAKKNGRNRVLAYHASDDCCTTSA